MRRLDYYVIFGGMALAVAWSVSLRVLGVGILSWQTGPHSMVADNTRYMECLYLVSDGSELREYRLGQPPLSASNDCPAWIELNSVRHASTAGKR